LTVEQRKPFWRVCSVLAVAATLTAGTAIAQQTLIVPAPSSQHSPRIRARTAPTPTPLPSPREVEELPPASTPAPTISAPTRENEFPEAEGAPPAREPILSEVFRGCWIGKVSRLDWIRQLPGGRRIGPWTAKTYRLCYKRVGGEPFRLTFTEAGVVSSRKITNAEGRIGLLSTDGQSYAQMRAYLHFDEYSSHNRSMARTFAVDEITNLDCRIKGDHMHVQGGVYGTSEGTPWFRAHWHAIFRHIPE
jgi:hypothetical protein